jgi:cell division septation protein DedD
MTVRWPKFPAAVSGPPARSSKPYYLVILGARLSQDQAAALRERARSAGVARDAYITQLGAR